MCYLNSFCEGSTLSLWDFSAKGPCDFSVLMTVTKRDENYRRLHWHHYLNLHTVVFPSENSRYVISLNHKMALKQ